MRGDNLPGSQLCPWTGKRGWHSGGHAERALPGDRNAAHVAPSSTASVTGRAQEGAAVALAERGAWGMV